MSILIENLLSNDSDLSLEVGESSTGCQTISSIDLISDNSILFLGNAKYIKRFLEGENYKGLCVVIVEKDKESELYEAIQSKATSIIISKNLPVSLTKASKLFYDDKHSDLAMEIDGRKLGKTSIHPSARIAQGVFIGEGVEIGSDTVIMNGVTILPNSKIGSGTTIYPNITIYPFCEIGDQCRIHSGTSIGGDGFGYNFFQGVHHKIWHFGGVKIGNNVEIGSNVSIDQGTFSPTIISNGVIIDNQVQIAHNVNLGDGVVMCGQAGLAGSVKVGAYSVFGGKAAAVDGVTIGQAVQIAGAAVVSGDVEDKEILGGHPARPIKEWLRSVAFLRKSVRR